MDQELRLRIVLEKAPAGVDFGLQKGSGSNYETIQKQRTNSQDLCFELTVGVKRNKDFLPDFRGPFVQGSPNNRFVYIDIGTYAGQTDSVWSRRLKIPLVGIPPEIVDRCLAGSNFVLETRVPGTGKDAGPNCGTAKPFNGWRITPSSVM